MTDPMNEPVEPRGASASRLEQARATVRGALLKMGFVSASGITGRAVVTVVAVLLAILIVLHVKAQNAEVQRYTDVLAQLTALKLIDARWDVAVLRSRADRNASTQNVVQSRDAAHIQRALEAALSRAKTNVLRADIAELKKAYAEKATLVTRFQLASADSQQALEAAMRADATVSGLVRSAWRDFPQRERLVAAENLVARVLAEAQEYRRSPTPAHRTALETAAADLPRAHSLPDAITAALARLASDVDQVLLLMPLEQMLGERLTVLDTGARSDALTETFRRDLSDASARRGRYQIALLAYSILLAVMIGYAAHRAYRQYRALAARHDMQSAELLAAYERLRDVQAEAAVRVVRDERTTDIVDANVTFLRRP